MLGETQGSRWLHRLSPVCWGTGLSGLMSTARNVGLWRMKCKRVPGPSQSSQGSFWKVLESQACLSR